MSKQQVEEDQVDVELSKMDGKIPRKRDALNCLHNENSQCVHCTSLDPFDEKYLNEKQIKHMSFQSFLRMTSKDKFTSLEALSCGIQRDRGCKPSQVMLSRQKYRHCDNVMFENPHIVDRFLDYWRETGDQRGGWLIGRYEVHNDVPLGVKAVVTAIYEPPQESTRDSLKILPDPKEEVLNEILKQLGLVKVGWIFSDLVSSANGKVKHFRNKDSHFLSASEIITAAAYQADHPNACKTSSDGTFGSKFTTVCVTGNSDNDVAMEGYQVSNQCMSLVKENILIPTRDAPELGYIRESSDEQYVPDVFFMEKDKYGNEIKKVGRPLPVEYLLLDVPVSTPKDARDWTYSDHWDQMNALIQASQI